MLFIFLGGPSHGQMIETDGSHLWLMVKPKITPQKFVLEDESSYEHFDKIRYVKYNVEMDGRLMPIYVSDDLNGAETLRIVGDWVKTNPTDYQLLHKPKPSIVTLMQDSADTNPEAMLRAIIAKASRHFNK